MWRGVVTCKEGKKGELRGTVGERRGGTERRDEGRVGERRKVGRGRG